MMPRSPVFVLMVAISASVPSATTPALASSRSAAVEGDWYVSDTTDNNTGEREVYAFAQLIDETDFVTFRMRCSAGKPTVAIEWSDRTFPDKVAVTIGAGQTADSDPVEKSYIFANSRDPIERGLIATPSTSIDIVRDLGASKYAAIAVHVASSPKVVVVSTEGTQRAWDRVVRHCPVQTLPRPPL